MFIINIIFWVLIFLVFYTYFGYACLIWVWIRIKGTFQRNHTILKEPTELPSIAFIIAAYNEEYVLNLKIINTLALDYPKDKIITIVVTDGSTDMSASIVANYPSIIHLHQSERRGKVAAINRAVTMSGSAEILVFSDANSTLNEESLLRLVSHYSDPKTGGVSGEKKVLNLEGSIVQGESFYWRYESTLKKLDAAFYTLVGAAGELFSIRKSIYEPVPEHVILDDFLISLKVCEKGFRVKYEPGAIATEYPSLTMQDEAERKKRISAGAFQALSIFTHLMNPFHYQKVSFQYISRRVFRWVVCPFAIPLILATNIFLVMNDPTPDALYIISLYIQLVFYILAILGRILIGHGLGRVKIFHIPYYFLFMNFSIWFGLLRYLKGGQSVIWQKAVRFTRIS